MEGFPGGAPDPQQLQATMLAIEQACSLIQVPRPMAPPRRSPGRWRLLAGPPADGDSSQARGRLLLASPRLPQGCSTGDPLHGEPWGASASGGDADALFAVLAVASTTVGAATGSSRGRPVRRNSSRRELERKTRA